MRVVIRLLVTATLAFGLAAFVMSCQKQPAQTATTDSTATAQNYKPEPAPAAVAINQRGMQVFLANCAMCHGNGGAGDGPIARELKERSGVQPPNLSNGARIAQLGKAGLTNVIRKGGAHTGRSNLMPAWGDKLEPAELDSLVEFVQQLTSLNPEVPRATIEKYLAAPPGSPTEGRHWFVYYCSGCHGPEGKGDGPNAATLRKLHNIWPRNLTETAYFAKKSDQELFVTIELGGGHAKKSPFMPAWTVTLKPNQIKDLISYIRVISNTPAQP